MPQKVINGWSAQLKKAAGLDRASHRRRFGQIRVEGVQAVREALSWAPQRVRDLFATPEVLAAHPEIDELADAADVYVHLGEADLLARVAPSGQGIFAVAASLPELPISELITSETTLAVCCVEASDPGNLGTIIRSADAAGADLVVVGVGSTDPYSPKVIRSAAGSTFHLPLAHLDPAEAVREAKAAGMLVALADARADVDLFTAQRPHGDEPALLAGRTLWLVGNEARGFTPEQRAWADVKVAIPMWGKAESLNLSVASALCLYASAFARSGR
ncbi:MAG: RNA methyltransferase [Actinomycetaceae bacterium]|nr:RNA methyltransferase [Actinomycetaceae bacterium]MDY5855352.1 RNA methyltransferase [Arcanobacterium sp.]